MVAPNVDSPMNHDRDIVVYTSYTRHALNVHPGFYMLSSVEAFVMVWFLGLSLPVCQFGIICSDVLLVRVPTPLPPWTLACRLCSSVDIIVDEAVVIEA